MTVDTGSTPRVVWLADAAPGRFATPVRRLVAAAGGRLDCTVVTRPAGPLPAAIRADVAAAGLAMTERPLGLVGDDDAGAVAATLVAASYRCPEGLTPAHRTLVLYDRTGGVGIGAELPAGSRAAAELVELSGAPVLARRGPALAVGVRDDAAVRLVLDRATTLAAGSGRARLTLVHKANAVKATDGMLYRVCQERAATSPIALEHVIVDALSAELLLRPTAYEALFVPPLYATLVEGFLAALAGGAAPGLLAAGAEAVLAGHRRGAPDVLLGLCAAAARLLEVSGQRAAADRLDDAVAAAAATGVPADPARVVADLLDHPR